MLISFLRGEMLHTEDDGVTATGAAQVATTEATATQTDDSDDFDKERAMATITKLRGFEKDAKAKLKRLEELEAAAREREQADFSQAEKLTKELADLKAANAAAQASLRRAALKDAALEAAQKSGLSFAPGALADAVALGAFDELEVAEDGAVPDMAEAVKKLNKQRPYLFVPATPEKPEINSGARGNGRSAPSTTTGVVRF